MGSDYTSQTFTPTRQGSWFITRASRTSVRNDHYPSMEAVLSHDFSSSPTLSIDALASPPSPPFSLLDYRSLTTPPFLPTRTRAFSGAQHAFHQRCSPDCTAAVAPYQMLNTAIGKASANDAHKAAAMSANASPLPAVPLNLQSRRGRQRTAPSAPLSHEPGLLVFDRKLWESTPPLPAVECSKNPSASGGCLPGCDHTSHFMASAILDEKSREFELTLPRSSSTPAVALLFSRDRSFSTASETSSCEPLEMVTNLNKLPIQPTSRRFICEGHLDGPVRNGNRFELGRHATMHGRGAENGDRVGPFGRVAGDAFDLAGYIGPELAATKKERLLQRDGDRPTRTEDVLSEVDWSFDIPLARAFKLALATALSRLPPSGVCRIAE